MANGIRLFQNYVAGRLLYDLPGASTAVADGVTNGTTTITSATAAFTAADVGAPISGTDIPAGAYIAAYTNPTTVTLSAAATGSGAARAWVISREKVFHSSTLSQLSTIGTTQHQMVGLDPDGLAGAPEVVMVTRHDAAALWAQITRGREATAARAHAAGMDWTTGAFASDLETPHVKATRAAALNIATGGVEIAWDAEEEDLWGFHDNAVNNGRLTCPAERGGLYRAGSVVNLGAVGVAGKIGSIYLMKNGVAIPGAEFAVAQAAVLATSLELSFPVRLEPGDWLTVGVYIDNAAPVAMNVAKSAFYATRVGS